MAIAFVRFDTTTRREGVALMPRFGCPLCRAADKVEISVYRDYTRIFGWLPLATTFASGAAYCHACSRPIPRESDPARLRAALATVAKRPRLRAFSGVIALVLIALAGFGTLAVSQLHQRELRANKAQMQAWLADPRPGDIDLADIAQASSLTYTLLKVTAISSDTVTYRVHREKMPHRAGVPSQAEGFPLGDADFSGPTFTVRKADIHESAYEPGHRSIEGTPLGRLVLQEAQRPQTSSQP
ncbi:MAG: hypothetical protein JOZ22_19460 [Acidobacteriia bacterium]|nr:hypothetical protein [Terriglobia bacterium]